MDHLAINVLTWTCIAIFVATGIVTLLALVGRLGLGGGDGSKHDFYLRALFAALILEIVGVSVTAYASSTTGGAPPSITDANRSEKGVGAQPPAVNPAQINWADTQSNADWGGVDYAYTVTSTPKYKLKDTTLCDATRLGYVATCWDSRPEGYPPGVDLTDIPKETKPPQWCTYKDNQIRVSSPATGRAKPGRVYICAQSVAR